MVKKKFDKTNYVIATITIFAALLLVLSVYTLTKERNFRISSSPEQKYKNIYASNGNYPDKVEIKWNEVVDASYNIYRSEIATEDNCLEQNKIMENAGSNPFFDVTAQSGKYYYYSIQYITIDSTVCSDSDPGFTN